ncbi:hypothetical protein D3C86_2225770 [compost metagenome]
MLLVGEHACLDAWDQQTKHHEKRVQQRRVVRILEVLVVHLPIARELVAVVAKDF